MVFTILTSIWEGFWPIFWSVIGVAATGLVGWLTTTGVGLINQKIKDGKIARWSSQLFQIIMSAVQAIQQSFVDTMKKEGRWNEETAREAKEKAYAIITSELTAELQKYITDNFGDMKSYLMNQIEAMLYNLKK